ncbi:MAG: response regulator [Anaerolineae bacterium]|nr:response regulator [Anaerolineae bacterium]
MSPSEQHIRVLVIDDSQEILNFVVQYVLLPNGYTPLIAHDGAEGLSKALTEVPDLIITDYEMPKMTGEEVLAALKENGVKIPTILMTSHGSEQIAINVFRLGVRDYIIKPFAIEELLDAMEQALAEVRLRREKATLTQRLIHINQELKQRLSELNTLYRVGKSVTALMPLNMLLERIADAAIYLTQADECIIFLNDPKTGRLREQINKQTTSQGIQLGDAHIGKRAEDLLFQSSVPGTTLHIPIQVGGKQVGILGVNNRTSLRPFSPHAKQILLTLVDYAAIGIENIRLLRQAEQVKEQEKQQVKTMFERYVAPSVVNKLLNQDDQVTLGGKQQMVSVLFADIRGFTQFSTRLPPEILVEVLNRHITVVAEALLTEEGTLDKFMGDAVMAFFNAPLPQPDHALRAVRAALAVHKAIAELHQNIPEEFRLHFGIAVSTGRVVVGNIGSPQLMNFTIIGETVNVCQRLQARAKGGQLFICEHTANLVQQAVLLRPMGTLELKGLPGQHVFEVLGIK